MKTGEKKAWSRHAHSKLYDSSYSTETFDYLYFAGGNGGSFFPGGQAAGGQGSQFFPNGGGQGQFFPPNQGGLIYPGQGQQGGEGGAFYPGGGSSGGAFYPGGQPFYPDGQLWPGQGGSEGGPIMPGTFCSTKQPVTLSPAALLPS